MLLENLLLTWMIDVYWNIKEVVHTKHRAGFLKVFRSPGQISLHFLTNHAPKVHVNDPFLSYYTKQMPCHENLPSESKLLFFFLFQYKTYFLKDPQITTSKFKLIGYAPTVGLLFWKWGRETCWWHIGSLWCS